ncbi:MAG: hypothetical protein J1E06_10450 [Acutalibacter sp.]|nr:hypothetical protein [Acutalibacter sp.]
MNIVFLSSNPDKKRQVQRIFEGSEISLSFVDNNEPEIQGENSREIALFAAQKYAMEHQVITVREDHSLYLNYLYPFPGPYLAYFDRKMEVDKLLQIYENATDRTGFFLLEAAVAFPNGIMRCYSHKVPIKLATAKSDGEGNFDRILILENEDLTFAEKKNLTIPSSPIWAQNYVNIYNDILQGKVKG